MKWRCDVGIVAIALLTLGCDSGHSSSGNPGLEPGQQTPQVPDDSGPGQDAWFRVHASTTLEALPEQATLVGITVDPTLGKRFVLTAEFGLYELTDAGAVLVFDASKLDRYPDLTVELPFTDVVALSSKRFALTAKNEGYLLDLQDQSLTLFFCYLPPIEDTSVGPTSSIYETVTQQGISAYQITRSVTHDADAGVLFAQPLTVDADTGEVYGAEVGMFSDLTGEPLNWVALPQVVEAEGILARDDGSLILAQGSELYGLAGPTNFWRLGSLDSFGIGEVGGAARLPGTERFLLLDRTQRRVFEVELQ